MSESTPLVVRLPAGKHAICCCGQTADAPKCDGSHVGTDSLPELVELPEDTNFAWCRCRQSGDIPRCDGTHTRLS